MLKTERTVRNARYLNTKIQRLSRDINPKVPSRALSSSHPELARQWFFERNQNWTPDDFSYGSGFIVWWLCEQSSDHAWEARIVDRTCRNRSGKCPFCAGTLVSVTNSLASLYPELAKEWCTEKNGLSAKQIVAGSAEKFWWKCKKGQDHYWQAVVSQRAAGSGCPCCANQKLSVTNSLASKYPELAQEWNYKLNAISPSEVVATTMSKFYWQCRKFPKHVWQASCMSRSLGSGCPKCNKGEKTDLRRWPLALKKFDRQKNAGVDPHNLPRSQKCWWKCPEDTDHVWYSSFTRKLDDPCLFCRGKKACKKNNLANDWSKLAKEWCAEKNKGLKPQDVLSTSRKIVWWQCPIAGDHRWKAEIYQRTHSGTGCPFCKNQKVSKTNSLKHCFPAIAKEWHPSRNKSLTPLNVVKGSTKSYWWKCPFGRDHEWQAAVSDRTLRGFGCPFCSNRRISSNNSLAHVHPRLAKEWDFEKNSPLKPEEVTSGSNRKVAWICNAGPDHRYRTSVYNKAVLATRCPYCTNRLVSVTNSLATKFPRIAKEWHPTKNSPVLPAQITSGSGSRFWFRCKFGHEWNCRLQDRTANGSNCPFCSRKKN